MVLTILVSLPFHVRFRVSLSVSTNTPAVIFTGIGLNIQISLARIRVFATLGLLVLEGQMPLHSCGSSSIPLSMFVWQTDPAPVWGEPCLRFLFWAGATLHQTSKESTKGKDTVNYTRTTGINQGCAGQMGRRPMDRAPWSRMSLFEQGAQVGHRTTTVVWASHHTGGLLLLTAWTPPTLAPR